jgi:hypothetical protein
MVHRPGDSTVFKLMASMVYMPVVSMLYWSVANMVFRSMTSISQARQLKTNWIVGFHNTH